MPNFPSPDTSSQSSEGVDVPLLETHGRPSWRHPLFESLFESLGLGGTAGLNVVEVSLLISSRHNKKTKKNTQKQSNSHGLQVFPWVFPWLCSSSGLFPNFKPALLARGELCLKARKPPKRWRLEDGHANSRFLC